MRAVPRANSNLKQIGLGIMQYAQDYDEKMVFSYIYRGPGNTNLAWWEDSIQPYIKSYQVMVCPSDSAPTAYNYARPAAPAPDPLLMSYSANTVTLTGAGEFVAAAPMMNSAYPALSLAQYPDPARTILIFDSTAAEVNSYLDTDWGSTSPATMIQSKRHLEGTNFLWADGHVKWLRDSKKPMWTILED